MTNRHHDSPRGPEFAQAVELCEMVLNQVITQSADFLRTNLIDLFDAFDESAFDAAIAAQENEAQILHFDAMRYVRLHKDRFITLFLFQFESSFEQPLRTGSFDLPQKPEAASLYNFGDLFKNNKSTIDALTDRITSINQDALEQLGLYFESMQRLRNANFSRHPLDPDELTHIFRHSCRELTISVEAFFLLLKLWESAVLDKLPSLYASTLQILHESDVALPFNGSEVQETRSGIAEDLNQQQTSYVQKARRPFETRTAETVIPAQGRATSMPNESHISNAELVAKLGKLQAPLAQRIQEGRELPTLDIRRIVEKVLEDNWASGNAGFLSPLQEAAIQSVVFLFDGGANDNELPTEIRGLLNQLQIPVLKLMLLDHERFKKGNHPAICLLNEAVCAGFDWGDRLDNKDVRFYKELGLIVNEILVRYVDDAQIFSEKLGQLQKFLDHQNNAAAVANEPAAAEPSSETNTLSARKVVGAEILKRLHGNLLPPTILDFIISQWLSVMTTCLEKFGGQSKEWKNALQTLDDLIASVQQHDDPKKQAEIKKRFSNIRNDVLKGLSRVSTDQQHSHRQLETITAVQQRAQAPKPKPEEGAGNDQDN